jgi:hypothetical protein
MHIHDKDVLSAATLGLLSIGVSSALAADPDPPKDPKQWKLDQLTFCMQSAASTKKLFLEELRKGCLSGARRASADASLCEKFPAAGGSPDGGAPDGGAPDGGAPACPKTEPTPAFSCTSCTPDPNVSQCSVSTYVSGSLTFVKTKDGESAVTTEEGTAFLLGGSYGGSLRVAAVAFTLKPSGHDGPYDLVTAVIDASFRYDEAIISSGVVTVNGRRYYSPESFGCAHREKGERWVLTTHVDRDCTSPVNQTKPAPKPIPKTD